MRQNGELVSSLSSAASHPYWQETVKVRPDCPSLDADTRCDLAIVGGGFTGLWTALLARRQEPQARIILLEASSCGGAASGRNGGFCAPSISHGVGVALERWPAEAETLVRMGRANLDEFAADIDHYGLEVEFERAGKLNVAEQPWQIEGLRQMQRACERFGVETHFLTGDALRAKFDSPIYGAGLFEPDYALLNPARMVAELRRVALQNDIDIHEHTSVQHLRETDAGMILQTGGGTVRAKKVVLATNIAPPLRPKLRTALIPVFDYAIVTRPLTNDELASIGWTGRHGIANTGNQFHYIRKTADNRILWGGYDAAYHFGSRRDAELLNNAAVFNRLAQSFERALPSLPEMTFTHAWGGIIDVSARTTFFAGLDCHGRVAYAMGFTGQGVSASRFAALVMLDLLAGRDTERARLDMLRRRPFPFPPEPVRWLGIRWAQRDLAREDETGKRSLLLRAMDALGIGFDS